jgi:hypothetical protein
MRLTALAPALLIAASAKAALVINIEQSGAHVVATLSGSLNLGTPDGSASQPNFNGLQNYSGNNNLFFTSAPGGSTQNFWGATTWDVPASGFDWGSNPALLEFLSPSSYSATGFTAFALRARENTVTVYMDQSYVAGTWMAATWQMDNKTLAEMDLVNFGSFVYNFSRFGGDTVTVNIGGTPVPEPSTYGLILGGLALAGAALRRRQRAQ